MGLMCRIHFSCPMSPMKRITVNELRLEIIDEASSKLDEASAGQMSLFVETKHLLIEEVSQR